MRNGERVAKTIVKEVSELGNFGSFSSYSLTLLILRLDGLDLLAGACAEDLNQCSLICAKTLSVCVCDHECMCVGMCTCVCMCWERCYIGYKRYVMISLEILMTQSRPAFIMLWVRHQVQAESKAVTSHLIGGYQGAGMILKAFTQKESLTIESMK